MLKRPIGKSDLNASVIAFGAWVTGGWMWGGADKTDSIKAVHAAYDHGVNFFDTAPVYGFGRSEEILGAALRDRRDKVIIATKCGLRWDTAKGEFFFYSDLNGSTKDPSKFEIYKYLHPDSIRTEVETSLRRLNTEYIDLCQTHWQDKTTPIEDTMAELLKLKAEGKIRAIGVSNATVVQMKSYGEIDSDQEKFSLLDRKIEKGGNIEYCHRNNIAFLAYSPLAQGLLTGKISPDRKFEPGDTRIGNRLFAGHRVNAVNEMLREFRPLCEKYGVSPGQLILAWTFHKIGITHLLVGARNPAQAVENAQAGNLLMFEEDIIQIDALYSEYYADINE